MNSQFGLFRILFGSFLAWHFLALIPYGTELFSNQGLISDASLNPTFGIFPNPLYLWDQPSHVLAFLILAVTASLTYALGIFRRTSALILWFIVTALFHRNNLTANPSLPYLGLILLLCTLIPPGEKFSLRKENPDWEMPRFIIPVASLLLALGYTFSGWTKLSSPSWIDGTAIAHVLQNPLARPGIIRDLLLNSPDVLLQLATWGALAAELLYLPLFLHRKSRPYIWFSLIGMHLSLIFLIDFADLSLGMLMIHLFTFDPKWLPAKGTVKLAFDADCLMCNRFLAFLADEDRDQRLTFQALPDDSEKTTMLATRNGIVHERSTAVLVIMEALGGHWRALAILGKIIPRPLRDLAYRSIAKNRHRFSKKALCQLPSIAVRSRLITTSILLFALVLIPSCSTKPLHQGRFPFSLMDRPPGGNHLGQADAAFREITRHTANTPVPKLEIQTGDVIAFHMSHRDAGSYLKKGKIQKIPYELFSYGHLALVVDQGGGPRLLQLAMKQAANIDDGYAYLDDKDWILYRPTNPINKERLSTFVAHALTKVSDPKKTYDYSGALGFKNVSITPESPEDIANEYTCVTIVQAALHYAGHPTKSIHRGGILDIVTPAQLIHSAKN